MSEMTPTFENEKEDLPSEESIFSVFENMTRGKEFSEVRKLEDENGIYLWEIKLNETEADGGTVVYSYGRKGNFKENKSIETAIHIAFFDEEGIPIGGHSVAKFHNGKWIWLS